jgi:hypothetical protein
MKVNKQRQPFSEKERFTAQLHSEHSINRIVEIFLSQPNKIKFVPIQDSRSLLDTFSQIKSDGGGQYY